MSRRAKLRPQGFSKPPYWDDAPAPTPSPPSGPASSEELSPTRYGDWVRNGVAVDF